MIRLFALGAVFLGYLWVAVFGTGIKVVFQWPGLLLIGFGLLLVPFVNWRGRIFSGFTACHIAVFILFAYMLTRALYSPVGYLARSDIVLIIVLFGVYIFFSSVVSTTRERLSFVILLLLLGLANTCVGIHQLKFENFHILPGYDRVGMGGQLKRSSGFYNANPHFAGFLQIAVLFAGSLVLFSRGRTLRFLAGALGVVSLFGIALSQSRGSLVAVTVGASVLVGVYFIFNRHHAIRKFLWNGKTVTAILGIACVLVVLGAVTMNGLGKRLDSLDNFFADSSRANFRAGAVDQWMESPLLGTGARSFGYKYLQYRPQHAPFHQRDPRFVHNDYLQQGAEYGLIGLLLVFIVICSHFISALQKVKNCAVLGDDVRDKENALRFALLVGAIAVVLAHAVHAFVDFQIRLIATGIPIAFCCSIMAGSVEKVTDRHKHFIALGTSWAALGSGISIFVLAWFFMPSSWKIEKAHYYLKEDNSSAAISYLHDASELDPMNAVPLRELALIRYNRKTDDFPTIVKMGYIRNALDAFKKVIRINSFDWRSNIGAGGCEIFLAWHSNPSETWEHWEKAKSYYERAIKIAPTKYEPREEQALYRLSLAHFFAGKGRLEDASREAWEALKNFTEVPEYFVEGAPKGHRVSEGAKSAKNLLHSLKSSQDL